jgi:hypothetical protein
MDRETFADGGCGAHVGDSMRNNSNNKNYAKQLFDGGQANEAITVTFSFEYIDRRPAEFLLHIGDPTDKFNWDPIDDVMFLFEEERFFNCRCDDMWTADSEEPAEWTDRPSRVLYTVCDEENESKPVSSGETCLLCAKVVQQVLVQHCACLGLRAVFCENL